MSAGLAVLLLGVLAGAGDAGVPAEPSLSLRPTPAPVERLREVVPPPLRFGAFAPRRGTWVEYRVRGGGAPGRVRLAHVADTEVEGTPVHQVELELPEQANSPKVAFWISAATPRVVLRMGVAMPPAAPVSVALDVPLESREACGEPRDAGEAKVPPPFAGVGRKIEHLEEGRVVATAVRAAVPLFGTASVRTAKEEWVAVAAGEGAPRLFSGIPILVPRLVKDGLP